VAQKMLFTCWMGKARLQTFTKIISYLMLFYSKNGYGKARVSVTLYRIVFIIRVVFGSGNKQHLFPHAAITNVF
jgi:hypothetical protein